MTTVMMTRILLYHHFVEVKLSLFVRSIMMHNLFHTTTAAFCKQGECETFKDMMKRAHS